MNVTNLYTLSVENLPLFSWQNQLNEAEQLALYLQQIIEAYKAFCPDPIIELPSVVALCNTLKCNEVLILNALGILKKNDYQFEICGLDAVIHLQDPLQRPPVNLADGIVPLYSLVSAQCKQQSA